MPANDALMLMDRTDSVPAVDGSVTVDRSGAWPVLIANRAGKRVAMSSRRNPVAAAEQLLDTVLRDSDPPVITVIGLGLGWILDALERRGSAARVLAFEPLPETIPLFHERRDWSSWLATGRLHIIAGPEFANAQRAWATVQPQAVPPVVVDPGLLATYPALIAPARGAAARARHGSPLDPRLVPVAQSMLHAEVRTMLEHAASIAKGAVVEIGAYVGGGTIAMTTGIRDSGRAIPMFSVEVGGQYLTHPDLPSADILGDLERNLRSRHLEPYVTLLRGRSSDPEILETIRTTLAERRIGIGLLVIDADGHVQRDFDALLPLCVDGCLLVVDDYTGPPENIKLDLTRTAVDALVDSGKARAFGLFGWSTWFGVYTPNGQ